MIYTRYISKMFLLGAVIWLTGCVSSTLDRAVAQCSAEGGAPSYTRSDGIEKFQCVR